ncbi:MAG: T9SS type A sorting domain-containing protein [Flavobacteriales bacterium]|nr:T9SS type A sorting domain-containing protein [Flavobacteriales bacterium]
MSYDVISEVLDSTQSELEFVGYLVALDSLQLRGMSRLDSNDWFDLEDVAQEDTGGVWHYQDSLVFTFTLSTDTSNLSFYPQRVTISQSYISSNNDTVDLTWMAYIYYSPWNTVEIYSLSDFYNGPREWLSLDSISGSEPTRISFSDTMLPSSTYNPNDTSHSEEWEATYLLETVPNAPFLIRKAPIHPDTMSYYCETYGDSATEYYNQTHAEGLVGKNKEVYASAPHGTTGTNSAQETFDEIVRGVLTTRIINDNGDEIGMPLSGVRVALKERDGIFTEEFDVAYTDDDGKFEFDITVTQWFEDGNLELFLEFQAQNFNDDFLVTSKGFLNSLDPFEKGIKHVVELGTVPDNQNIFRRTELNANVSNPFYITHILHKSYEFVKNNSNSTTVNTNLSSRTLRVLLNSNSNQTLVAPRIIGAIHGTILWGSLDPIMNLSPERSDHESTIYHEFGHYLMWTTQGHDFISVHHDTDCPNVFGHTGNQEGHLRISWSEGWANAMRYILDGALWKLDVEYGFRAFRAGNPDNNNITFEFLENARLGNFNNGLRSEYLIGTSIYDLWDGPNKSLPNTETLLTIAFGENSIPNYSQDMAYQDDISVNLGGEWINEVDDVELTFSDILAPLYLSTGNCKNFYDYIERLIEFRLYNDCNALYGISKVLRHNRIQLDIVGIQQAIQAGSYLDFNTSISSDELYEQSTFEDFGKDVFCIGHTDEIVLKSNIIEANAGETKSLPNNQWLEDEVDRVEAELGSGARTSDFESYQSEFKPILHEFVTESLLMGFNFPNTTCSLNLNTNIEYPFELDLQTCSDISWQFGNTAVNIGQQDATNSHVTSLTFNSGSELVLSENTILTINNGSTLIIEEGGFLKINGSPTIVLDGEDAKILIRGSLILEEGAAFEPTSGNNGFGVVEFDMPNVNTSSDARSRIKLNPNSTVVFKGTDNTDELVIISNNVLWLDDYPSDDGNGNKTAEIRFEDCKVSLGTDAVLNLGCKTAIDNVTITNIPGDDEYKGVYLWGHKNSIENSIFSNGIYGLTSLNTVGGNGLHLSSVSITDCENALTVEGVRLTMYDCDILDNSGYGVSGSMFTQPGILSNTVVDNTTGLGFEYQSNSTAPFFVWNNLFTDNSSDLKVNTQGNVYLGCNEFNGNTTGSANADVGIEAIDAQLIMSNWFYTQSGFNEIVEHDENIRLRLDAKFQLNEGSNQLSALTNLVQPSLSSAEYAIVGTSGFNSSPVIANGNLWDESTAGANGPVATFNAPYDQYNYLVNYTHTVSGFPFVGMLSITDLSPISKTTFDINATNGCPTSPDMPRDGSGGGDEDQGEEINTSSFAMMNVSDAVDSVLYLMSDTNCAYDTVMMLWTEILNHPYTQLDSTTIGYVDLAIDMVCETVGQWLSNQEIDSLDSNLLNEQMFSDALDITDHWETFLDTSSIPGLDHLENHVHFAEGLLYHAAGDLSSSKSQFQSMVSWADEMTYPVVDYWICRINREEDLLEIGYDYTQLDSLEICEVVDTLYQGTLWKGILHDDDHTLSNVIKVFPNPTSEKVVLELPESISLKGFSLRVFNVKGQLMMEQNVEPRPSRIYETQITGLPGVYFVEIKSRKESHVVRVIKK